MSGNNPWGSGGGGRGPQRPSNNGQTPPELEKIFEDARKKFGGYFGGGSGGSGGSSNGGSGSNVGITIIAAAAILGWMFTGFYRVKSGEQGVEMRFGKYVNTELAGLNYHLPYPIETVEVVDIEENRESTIGYGTNSSYQGNRTFFQNRSQHNNASTSSRQMLTGDENIVDIQFNVRWKVANPAYFLFNIEDQSQTIEAVSESVMREVVGRNKIDYILTDGRGALENEVKDNVQKTLDSYKAGVQILQVAIKEALPPEQVIDDFKDVQRARADEERFVQEANSYANKILPKARGQAKQLLQQAEAYKERAVAEAVGDTSRYNKIFEEYKKAPEVTRKRLYLETMEDVYTGKKKVLLSGDQGANILPYYNVQDALRRNHK